MLGKKASQICLAFILITAVLTMSFGTAEASSTKYHLIVTSTEGGEVIQPEDDFTKYEEGDKPVIQAEAEENYEFIGWNGDTENIENPYSEHTQIEMQDNYTIKAEFTKETRELTIDVDGEGKIVRPVEVNLEYEHGETVVLEAEGAKDHTFVEWTGDTENIEEPTSTLTTIVMEDDYDITAEFEKKHYELTIEVDDEDKGQIIRPEELNSEHEYGDDVIIEVEAEDGYEFKEWTGDTETIDDTESTLAVIEILDNHEITAEFESESQELRIEWGIIALLAVVLAWFIIKKLTTSGKKEEKSDVKKGVCGNCGEIIPKDSLECPECNAALRPPDVPMMKKASDSD